MQVPLQLRLPDWNSFTYTELASTMNTKIQEKMNERVCPADLSMYSKYCFGMLNLYLPDI
jgi:hypothetical protein